MNKLYHYIHCPFCLRIRFILGLLKIEYESIVLSYDDEIKPKELSGTKMLPIFEFSNGEILNESLDIIKKLDKKNQLKLELLNDNKNRLKVEKILTDLGGPIHNLCMPYWIYTKEFDQKSREYFEIKKSKKRGPFHLLMRRKDDFLKELGPLLINLEKSLTPFYHSDSLSIFDIMIASHLWGLYIFPEFQFSNSLHNYLQNIKKQCHFDYHADFF